MPASIAKIGRGIGRFTLHAYNEKTPTIFEDLTLLREHITSVAVRRE